MSLIKIPTKFIDNKYSSCVKERHLYLNPLLISSIEVNVYNYGEEDQYNVSMQSMQGYVSLGIATYFTKELKDEFIEWLDDELRKAKL